MNPINIDSLSIWIDDNGLHRSLDSFYFPWNFIALESNDKTCVWLSDAHFMYAADNSLLYIPLDVPVAIWDIDLLKLKIKLQGEYKDKPVLIKKDNRFISIGNQKKSDSSSLELDIKVLFLKDNIDLTIKNIETKILGDQNAIWLDNESKRWCIGPGLILITSHTNANVGTQLSMTLEENNITKILTYTIKASDNIETIGDEILKILKANGYAGIRIGKSILIKTDTSLLLSYDDEYFEQKEFIWASIKLY